MSKTYIWKFTSRIVCSLTELNQFIFQWNRVEETVLMINFFLGSTRFFLNHRNRINGGIRLTLTCKIIHTRGYQKVYLIFHLIQELFLIFFILYHYCALKRRSLCIRYSKISSYFLVAFTPFTYINICLFLLFTNYWHFYSQQISCYINTCINKLKW